LARAYRTNGIADGGQSEKLAAVKSRISSAIQFLSIIANHRSQVVVFRSRG
jgi:hypothetical protein